MNRNASDKGKKRSREFESDARSKRQSTDHDGNVVLFRVCCPIDKSGQVIGKGGDIIRSIRDKTGARVKLDDPVKGLNERAIIIYSPDKPGAETCGAQDALLRVIEQMHEPDGKEQQSPAAQAEKAELVMVIDRQYMAMIVGKRGECVTRMREATGCTILIQKSGHISPLAGPDEETIKVDGPYESVKLAGKLIVDRIRDGVQRSVRPAPSTLALAYLGPQPSMAPPGGPTLLPPAPGYGPQIPSQPAGRPFVPPPDVMMPPGVVLHSLKPVGVQGADVMIKTEYRLLVLDDRVGGIIGKGGERLRAIREESRADVVVEKNQAACSPGDRMVICSSSELLDSEICAAAEALMMSASRVVSDRGAADATGMVSLKLLVTGGQMGAIIGVKGGIIKQLMSDTGAQINIPEHSKESKRENEVLKISGKPKQVMEAARLVTMLLRGSMIRQQTQNAGTNTPAPSLTSNANLHQVPVQQYMSTPLPLQQPIQQPPMQQQYTVYTQPQDVRSYNNAPPAGPPPQQYQPPPQQYSTAVPGALAPLPTPTQQQQQQQRTAAPVVYQGYNSSTTQQYTGYAVPPAATIQPGGYALPPAASLPSPPQQSGYNNPYLPQKQPAIPPGFGFASVPSSNSGNDPSFMSQGRGSGGMTSSMVLPTSPPLGSLLNPIISSTGLQPGIVQYTVHISPLQVGKLLGARGSNVASIRKSSLARIKVHDNDPSAPDRKVDITGTLAQVSQAMGAIQAMLSSMEGSSSDVRRR
ncbi:hypothetical protein CEUSTIGMA_g6867.t1 [Chlamydomonas eustigma]|uniref:K Homology domain-containing protein n=1 Tax=Chlamydomonas eustigma TaxID=1157962 RepID=A0A250X8N8_9CHLO|nr:hypothetical protein CEUSTIGMA_g6867.t1 [Chlamydomonas eustigma]|eukprot:GAX79426.1 hypothetical protein CEUSTIGMA_g6867.t1 [Chlamydomonas eustigma]